MSWVTIIWSMIAATCLTLAGLQLLVWCRNRSAWANLLFSLVAIGTAGMAACEFMMMRAGTTAEFGAALRWVHVPAWLLIIALVGFVRVYLRVGRPWLAWMVCGLRTLSLFLNFVFTPNLNYHEITHLRHIRFLGETISVGEGVSNPWMMVGQLSLVLLVVFVLDGVVTAARQRSRRSALVLGGAILFFTLIGTIQAVLGLWHIVETPLTPSLFFLGVVGSMGYELSTEVLRAAKLANELRESEQRFRQVAETAGEFIWEVDPAGLYTYASPSVEQILGYRAQDLIGKKHFYDLFVPSAHEEMKATLLQVFADRRTFRCTPISRIHRANRVVHMESSGTPVVDTKGKLLAYRGADMDVTERKKAEFEIAEQRDKLVHLSRVSTLGEISGSLAHELNQPLGAIIVNADSAQLHLQQTSPNLDEVRAILTDIQKDGLRAGDIIHGMRAFLKRKELETKPIDLRALAMDTLKLISADAATRKITLDVKIPPDLPGVTGDRVHLQQVLLNLLINGMDAMSNVPELDRRLTIRTDSPDPETVEIAVSDSGCGIPPADLERVFTPFHTTKQGGLGLGLAICRSIVEAHGGSISVSNNPDRGTTARFRLPARRGDLPRP